MDNSKNTGANFQSLGGQSTAIKSRQISIENYYKNPNICKYCNEIIHVGNYKVSQIKRKYFCNKTCAAKSNKTGSKRIKDRFCIVCNIKLELRRNKKGNVIIRKYCTECLRLNMAKKITKLESESDLKECLFKNQTKGSLFDRRKNWQSASSTLRRHARLVYDKSQNPKKCKICGYDKHFEVSHIKSVSSFPNEVSVSDINHISNLIALCRNCHWELDNNLIKLEDAEVRFELT